MIEWGTIASLLCPGLLVFLFWKEWSRPNRTLLTARLVATVIAVLCLYLLANPPSYTRKVEQAENQLIILTDGFEQDSVRALSGFDKMPLYDLRDDQEKLNNEPGIDEMLTRHPGSNTIHLFGYGLPGYELEKLQTQSVIFHPSRPPNGFVSLQYKKELEQGELLQIQGRILRRDSGRVNIFLTHFGKVLDSARAVDGFFQLIHIPAHVGAATYSLIALQGKDTLEKEILPMVVNEGKQFKVLFLSSAPGFETRFLKDWLVRKGYQLVSRTRVSKNAYSKEFVNEERVGMERINEALMNGTDLVVSDQAALASLSSSELAVIRQSIASNGTGLMYWADGEGRDPFGTRVISMPGGEQQKLDLVMNDSVGLKILNTENQSYVPAVSSAQPIVKTRDGKVFASAKQVGKGRVVVNTVSYSYKWILSGSSAEYDRFWTTIINKTMGKASGEKWQIAPEWGFVHQPFKVRVETLDPSPRAIVEKQQVYLENDPAYPVKWSGKYWPGTVGWHNIEKMDGGSLWFYVFNKGEWRSLRMSNMIRENMEFVSSLSVTPSSIIEQGREENRQVPLIVYALLFMIAAGFLWFENKRMGG